MSQFHVRSPLPGTFYRKPAPDQPEYKRAGDAVAIGDVVGLVEVMKSYHEVSSDVAGVVVEYQVDNEDPIMAGQPVLVVESGDER